MSNAVEKHVGSCRLTVTRAFLSKPSIIHVPGFQMLLAQLENIY